MDAKAVTPILNVSDIVEGFAWFEKLGWKKGFDWGNPPTFGSVCSGECEIFLCQGAQGGRGRSALSTTNQVLNIENAASNPPHPGVRYSLPSWSWQRIGNAIGHASPIQALRDTDG